MNLSNKNIIHVKTDNVEYIQFKRLLEYKNIAHCYTLKSDGQLNFNIINKAINRLGMMDHFMFLVIVLMCLS